MSRPRTTFPSACSSCVTTSLGLLSSWLTQYSIRTYVMIVGFGFGISTGGTIFANVTGGTRWPSKSTAMLTSFFPSRV